MIDPLENGLFDMPDYEHTEDETFPPFPPPSSPGRGDLEEDPFGNREGEEDGEVSKLAEVPVAKRRTVKRPQPKLDANRLISEKGLPALRTLFDDVKFKSKGHETENLKLLMQKMENWAHRLYPKMQFEEFIDKVESLGSKKEVQTCLKRIRLDMPITHEDYVEEAEVQVLEESDPAGDGGFPEDPFVHSTPAPASLTEEQQRRIELNKQLALERRLAKQKQLESSQNFIQGDADEPSTSSSGQNISQENEGIFNQSTSNQTPLKQKPAVLQNSPLYDNECASPVPNGIVDDDDDDSN
ncbi:LOW QUALITY PROTEIN: TIMELESS-interacting protein [Ctenopharyngodon idella]|uniref:LOW QUALITY PROTEIN: TIMELESS-interacting protein n=1 Tax=Ctenopharyngodon idella TaxID=7959 RepID=UPI002232BA4D|nr:LOW QUALITY PROTEIN: TIMELESS-interacting protein [Ctenopharyngodon idella]